MFPLSDTDEEDEEDVKPIKVGPGDTIFFGNQVMQMGSSINGQTQNLPARIE